MMEQDEELGEREELVNLSKEVVIQGILPEVELDHQECSLQCIYDEVA